jgi:hypothetical protein
VITHFGDSFRSPKKEDRESYFELLNPKNEENGPFFEEHEINEERALQRNFDIEQQTFGIQ